MKRSLLLVLCLLSGMLRMNAQVTSVSVETFYTDDGTVTGYPAGHTTYRIYANTTSPADRVVTMFGDDDSPFILNVTGNGVWNHPAGGVVGNSVNCALYGVLPAVQYDSYLTVDYTCNSGATNTIYTVQDAAQPWLSQVWNTAPYGAGNTLLNSSFGSAWFSLTSDANNLAGADNKVLIAQITTNGTICGIINLQVFPNYSGQGSPYIEQLGLQFGTISCGMPGCTDPEALNYDPESGLNNGLCLYPCDLAFDLDATAPSCFGLEDGSISFAATGAQDLVEYSFNNTVVGFTPPSYTDLANGTYTLQIRDTRFDNELMNPGGIYGSCSVTQDIVFNTTALEMSGSVATATSCADLTDGCISVETYGGGTGIITYSLKNEDGSPVTGNDNQPVVTVVPSYCGLAAGVYYFEATDENGCTLSGTTAEVTSPSALVLTEGNEQAATCFNSADGTKEIQWTGGTGNVSFSMEDDGVYDIAGSMGSVTLSGIAAGSNMVYASDENGCETSLTFDLTGGPAITVSSTQDNPSCSGDADGSVEVTAEGGTGVLTYSIDGDSYSSTGLFEGLSAGMLTVYVRDENNCETSIDVTLSDPEPLTASASVSPVLCNGGDSGSITIEFAGGTEPFAFSVNGGLDYLPSPVFTGLEAGDFNVVVVDANGCSFTIEETFTLTEPEAIEASATATSVSCNGEEDGSISIDVTGGTVPYQYSTGGAFGGANPIAGLGGGTYTVTVADANGCEFIIENVEVAEPDALVLSNLTPDPIDETPGGNSVYSVAGGTQPYSYSWTNAGGAVVSTAVNLPAFTSAADAGTYTLNVTDDNGCVVTSSITITGVNDMNSAYVFAITPNPSNGLFRMNMSGLNGERMSYSVVDAQGRIARSVELGSVAGSRTENIDITEMAAGVYYIRIVAGDASNSIKVVKQ